MLGQPIIVVQNKLTSTPNKLVMYVTGQTEDTAKQHNN